MENSMKTLNNVLQEYFMQELDLELKIKEILDKIQISTKTVNLKANFEFLSWKKENDLALQRNKMFTKDLEHAKAKLRSLHCYQPADEYLTLQINKYNKYMEEKYSKQ